MYLEEHSVRRWNTLKHVSSNVVHVSTRGSFGDDLWKIQHGALQTRERRCNGGSSPAEASGDIDEGG
jgi:hypothetical protein